MCKALLSIVCCGCISNYFGLYLLHLINKDIKMIKALTCLAVIVVFTPFSALSKNSDTYLGVLYGSQTYDTGALYYDDQDIDLDVITPLIGYQFNDYLSVELRLGFGVGDDKKLLNLINVDITDKLELDLQQGVFLKGAFPLSDSVSLFAYGGYVKTRYQASSSYKFHDVDNTSVSSGHYSNKGASVGAGISYFITNNWSLNGEMQYFDQEDETSSRSFNLGLTYKF